MLKFINFLFILFLLSNPLHAANPEQISIQLQWKHQFQFAGYYIAKEKGFYSDEGLDVTIKEYQYGMDVTKELLEKRSTFGVGRPTLLIQGAEKKDVVLLASIFQSSPNVLLTTKKSQIKSIKDFKNKKIMITGDAKLDAIVMAMVVSNGLSIDDMKVQEHSFNINDLIKNKTDIYSAYISNEPYLLKEQGIEFTVFDPKDYGFDFYNDILYTTQNYLYTDLKNVKKFTLASLEGWKYAFENIDETVELIFDKYNTQGKSKEALLYEAHELKKLAYYHTDQLGEMNKAKVSKIIDYYKIMGLIKKDINIEDFVFNFSNSKFYLNTPEKQYLKDKQKITMCIHPNCKPFESLDKNGNHVGVVNEYFKIFEKITKTKFELLPTSSWDESLKNAKQRKCDILSLASPTSTTKEYLNFTNPYLDESIVIAAGKEVTFINDISELYGKDIAILKACPLLEELRKKHPSINYVEVDSIDDGLKEVRKGNLSGYIGALRSISYVLENEDYPDLKIAGKLNNSLKLAIGVRSDDETLFKILQKAIKSISAEQKQEILSKWASVKYERTIDHTLLYEVLFVFTLILIIVLFFYKKLYSMNEKLKDSYAEIEKLAVTDKLTQLYNRHKIDFILEYEKKNADRYNTSFGIIIFDIDHFKNVNDTHGHNVGDITLKKFASILTQNTREVDTIGRWGGEEFIIIIHHTDPDTLVNTAENLRYKIENAKYDIINYLTASLGVTIYQKGETLDATIARADSALYNSKENGRNKVTYL